MTRRALADALLLLALPLLALAYILTHRNHAPRQDRLPRIDPWWSGL